MSTEKQYTEEMILATNPTRPRLTPADIEAVVKEVQFLRPTGQGRSSKTFHKRAFRPGSTQELAMSLNAHRTELFTGG